jgi:hypothetical protein
MPDLFDFDGSDNSRPEHECIELPYRIGVFYPVISPLLCASLCFFNGFCWSGARRVVTPFNGSDFSGTVSIRMNMSLF